MNEKFLSRGKRKEHDFYGLGGEWVYGIPIQTHIGTFICFEENPHYCGQYGYMEIEELSKVIPETIGYCTGLTDKNGKMIFEGDIIKLGGHKFKFIKANGYEFVVKFGKCGGVQNVDYEVGYIGFYVTPIGKDAKLLLDSGVRTDILYWLNAYEVYVIGNIHDNPELIGGNANET